jgi:hypothetical protein
LQLGVNITADQTAGMPCPGLERHACPVRFLQAYNVHACNQGQARHNWCRTSFFTDSLPTQPNNFNPHIIAANGSTTS